MLCRQGRHCCPCVIFDVIAARAAVNFDRSLITLESECYLAPRRGSTQCLGEEDDMKFRSAQRARPLRENEVGPNAMKGFAYGAESSMAAGRFSSNRDGRERVGLRVASREAAAFAIVTSLVLLSSLLAILLTLSGAGARDFSSQTVNPRGSYSGVRMQQGNPQLDNDGKRNFGGPPVKIEPRSGSLDMQQRKGLRHIDGVNAEKRGKNSMIYCGTNCRK